MVRSVLPFQSAGMSVGCKGVLLSVSGRSPKSGQLPAAIKSDKLDDEWREGSVAGRQVPWGRDRLMLSTGAGVSHQQWPVGFGADGFRP